MSKSKKLLKDIRACTLCSEHLPLPPRPICNFSDQSKILIVGQAPGMKVHNSGIPWNDESGKRLRKWLNVTEETFYNPEVFAIVPMGFCYPGKGKSGDLPPRPECSEKWMNQILSILNSISLTILIGKYAQNYFLKDHQKQNLTETVKNWKSYQPDFMVLPHPSPRNNIWIKKNPWFEDNVIPILRKRISELI